MTFYVSTPMARMARRNMMMNRFMDNDWPTTQADVFVPVDVKAEDDAFVITALLPGVKSEDLNIQIVNETVSIQGELQNEREENSSYLLKERPSGKFYRVLTLPETLDASKAEADMENGVLMLRVPKAEQARPKTIKVTAK